MKKNTSKTAGVGDAAVQKATGKTWAEWFAVLDAAGAKKMTHQEIVAYLVKHHQVGPWWQQMVTVGYEQGRGLRKKHQKPGGYQISRSKTLAMPVSKVFRAWNNANTRSRWLGDVELTIRKAATNRSLRITWPDGRTNVEVLFYPRGPNKVQVTVQHDKLPTAMAGERAKNYWGEALDRLQAFLE
jgi:uncharacterized protein YndB with AHSA1/START domain